MVAENGELKNNSERLKGILNGYSLDEILDELLKCNASRKNVIKDRQKKFKFYCNKYLDTDADFMNKQLKLLGERKVRIRCGNRYDIINLKEFLSGNWRMSVSVQFWNKKRKVKNEVTNKLELNPGYDYTTEICITHKDKQRNIKLYELHKYEKLPLDTLTLLFKVSNRHLRRIINGT